MKENDYDYCFVEYIQTKTIYILFLLLETYSSSGIDFLL